MEKNCNEKFDELQKMYSKKIIKFFYFEFNTNHRYPATIVVKFNLNTFFIFSFEQIAVIVNAAIGELTSII